MIHVGDMLQKKRVELFISSCTSSSVLLRSSRTCSQNNVWIYQHEVTMSEYFATEKKGKRQRCQIGCKVNVKSTERNNRPGSNSSCKYFLFFFLPSATYSTCLWPKTYLSTSDWCRRSRPPPIWLKQTKNYLRLFDTGLYESDDKPLAVATSHVSQTNIDHTHIKPKLITTMNSFARVKHKFCRSTIYTAYQYILATKERRIYWHQNIIYISGEGKRK